MTKPRPLQYQEPRWLPLATTVSALLCAVICGRDTAGREREIVRVHVCVSTAVPELPLLV